MAEETWTVNEQGEPIRVEGRPRPTTFAMSAGIGALAAALAKAQAAITGAGKSKVAKVRMKSGGEYSYKYADLASVIDACRAPLAANGLAIIQPVNVDGRSITVTTILAHASGEWVRSDLTLIAMEPGPQAAGSAITYGRKYGLAAMVGVAGDDDDDDGAAAQGRRGHHDVPPTASPTPKSGPAEAAKPSPIYDRLYSARTELLDGEKPDVAGMTLENADAWVAAVKRAHKAKQITADEFDQLREFHQRQSSPQEAS